MAARLKDVSEPKSLKHYRNWSDARTKSKDAASEVGEVVKVATNELDVGKKPFKLACELKRMDPVKSSAFLRDFDQLVVEFGLEAQTELEDVVGNTSPAA